MTIQHAFKIKDNFATSLEINHGVISIIKHNSALQLMAFLAINSYPDGISLLITFMCLLTIFKAQKKVFTAIQMTEIFAIRTMGQYATNNQVRCVQPLMESTLKL